MCPSQGKWSLQWQAQRNPLSCPQPLFPEVAPAPPCPSPPESESLLTSCSIPTSPISHSTQLSAHILVQENTLCWSNLAPISSQGRFTASGAGQGEDTATPAWTEPRKVPDWETVTQWTLGELGGRSQKMADSWGGEAGSQDGLAGAWEEFRGRGACTQGSLLP